MSIIALSDMKIAMEGIHPKWMEIFKSPAIMPKFTSAISELIKLGLTTTGICPPVPQIFAAFKYFPPTETKAVIIGQDPYFGKGEAHGLSFSVENGAFPPSLKNIQKAIKKTCEQDIRNSNLTSWAQQGVLLLNTQLTIDLDHKSKTPSHKFWMDFTRAIINWMNINCTGVIFMLWGASARTISKSLLSNNMGNHHIMEYTHPSPLADIMLSADKKFVNCMHFADTNAILGCEREIKWGEFITDAEKKEAAGLMVAEKTHVIFTDGSCSGNGKKNAYATWAYYVARGPLSPVEKADAIPPNGKVAASNNRGELLGVINAIEFIVGADPSASAPDIVVVTDSEYCKNIVNSWLMAWRSQGRLELMKNPDLLLQLEVIIGRAKKAGFTIQARYTPAHMPSPDDQNSEEYFMWGGNDKVDKMAQSICKKV